jgi:hypothetical protein
MSAKENLPDDVEALKEIILNQQNQNQIQV